MNDIIARARAAVETVPDPELPALTIADLGILRDVTLKDGIVEVTITPTYSGCPAMVVITLDIDRALRDAGIETSRIRQSLAPAWSSDWLSEAARAKLAAEGIAPPGVRDTRLFDTTAIQCPRCGSMATEQLSVFGATACKSFWRCTACREPFDHFKCH